MLLPDNDKSPPRQERRASLGFRLDRAANEINPFLMVLAIGLLVLNLTLYVAMSLSKQPSAATMPRQPPPSMAAQHTQINDGSWAAGR